MNIRQKMIVGAALITTLPVIITATVIGFQANTSGRASLQEEAKEKLVSLRSSRKEQIETYLETVIDQIKTFSNDRMIIDAMQEFNASFSVEEQIPQTEVNDYLSSLRNYYTIDYVREYESRNQDEPPNMNNYLSGLDQDSVIRQYQYIANNENPLGSKEQLMQASDGSVYSKLHSKYHPSILHYLQTFGYYDIFLADPESGDIVYSVFKELDFSTSLISGPYSDAGIGQAFRLANKLDKANEVAVVDYAPYLPSYQDQAIFLASPIFDGDKKVGILIFQAPIDKINDIMTSQQSWLEYGLGNSGETYLVGSDYLMRNDSRFLIEDKNNYLQALRASGVSKALADTIAVKNTSIGLQTVRTKASDAALAGQIGFDIIDDYRGVSVLSAYTPINIGGLKWAMMAEIDTSEAFAATDILANKILISSVIVGLLILISGGLASFFFFRQLTRPISDLYETVKKVSAGDYLARSTVNSNDEFGELSSALNTLLDDRISAVEKAEKENDELNNAVIEVLQATMPLKDKNLTAELPVREDITGPLADSVNSIVEVISSVLQQVHKVARHVENSSRALKSRSDEILKNSHSERNELSTTVTKLVELTDGTNQIADLSESCNDLATHTSSVTQKAASSVKDTVKGLGVIRETIHETEKRIKRLGERSQDINDIINIINGVAERTHVLALNASMQAVTAGEQGKAFAVIAEEVKVLAQNARDATSQISSIVDNIQVETKGTTETMSKAISDVIEGSKVAALAGEQMNETQKAAGDMVHSVKQIAQFSQQQLQVSEELHSKTKELLNVNDETSKQLDAQEIQTKQMLNASRAMLTSIREFKLPASETLPENHLPHEITAKSA